MIALINNVPLCRNVQISELLCNRCQNQVGFLFWDIDHSDLESGNPTTKSLEHKEYVKLYKHKLACREQVTEKSVVDYYSDLMGKRSQLFSTPFMGRLLTDSDTFEILMAQFFKHQAEESFYRFVVVSDDPNNEKPNEVVALIRLLNVSSKVVLSKESISLPNFSTANENSWNQRRNGVMNDFAVVRLTYLERSAVGVAPGSDLNSFERVSNQWQKVSKLCHICT